MYLKDLLDIFIPVTQHDWKFSFGAYDMGPKSP